VASATAARSLAGSRSISRRIAPPGSSFPADRRPVAQADLAQVAHQLVAAHGRGPRRQEICP